MITAEHITAAHVAFCKSSIGESPLNWSEFLADFLNKRLAPKEPALSALQKKLAAEGFTPWFGGEAPIKGDTIIETVQRSERRDTRAASGWSMCWHHEDPSRFDIIAYRLAQPPVEKWSLAAYLATLPGFDAALHKPHRTDFTEEMLTPETRPVLKEEILTADDEVFYPGWRSFSPTSEEGNTTDRNPKHFYRTRRPLPLPAPVVACERSGSRSLGSGISSATVYFQSAFPSAEWRFNAPLVIVNTTDDEPLNLMCGTITEKSASGFTVLLSGATDSENYRIEYACGTPAK